MNKNLWNKAIDSVAIERLRQFEQDALRMSPEDGYWVAYSGGKDSDVILDLVRRSGVKYRAVHNLTTCDPPECVCHVKTQPDVEISRPPLTMWELIRKRGLAPRRNARFCCEAIKERNGEGHIVVTGIRWGESKRRRKRSMVESCMRKKTKRYLHAIIDWSTSDVWTYIKGRDIPYCSLYDEGQKRVGCVLCPMVRDVEHQMNRWPQIARAWERAVKATFKPDYKSKFTCDEDYWQWWLDRDSPSPKPQVLMFDN